MVFQLQLALFQTSQLQFLLSRILRQPLDDRIEVTMFHFKFDDAALNIF